MLQLRGKDTLTLIPTAWFPVEISTGTG